MRMNQIETLFVCVLVAITAFIFLPLPELLSKGNEVSPSGKITVLLFGVIVSVVFGCLAFQTQKGMGLGIMAIIFVSWSVVNFLAYFFVRMVTGLGDWQFAKTFVLLFVPFVVFITILWQEAWSFFHRASIVGLFYLFFHLLALTARAVM